MSNKITFRLPDELKRDTEQAAACIGISTSALMRLAAAIMVESAKRSDPKTWEKIYTFHKNADEVIATRDNPSHVGFESNITGE